MDQNENADPDTTQDADTAGDPDVDAAPTAETPDAHAEATTESGVEMNRLHSLSALTYALNYGVMLLSIGFLGGIALGATVDISGFITTGVIAPLAFLVGAGYGILYYLRFEYSVTDTTFDVASGVLSRRDREIPYRRIQNVDVRQGFIQRVLSLAAVSVETAGGGDTEAVLYFVSEAEARRLQREIRSRTARAKSGRTTPSTAGEAEREADTQQETVDPDQPTVPVAETDTDDIDAFEDAQQTKSLFSLDSRELFLYSFTSFRPAAVAAVLFVFFFATEQIIDHLVSIAAIFGGPDSIDTGDTVGYGILTIVSAIYGIIATYLISVIYTFTQYYGFSLGRAGDDFVYERGLLQRFSGSIPAEKVQSVTVTDNPLQRRIRYSGLWVETAGYGPNNDSGSQSAVPLATKTRVYGFAERLTGVETPDFESPPPIARRRYFVRYSLIATVIVAIAFGVSLITPLESWYLAALIFLAVPPAAHLRYVNLGYYVGEDHLVVRGGFWKRRTTVIPYYRIQTISTRRSIFQRRLGIASLVVDTASSQTFVWNEPIIYDIDLADAREAHSECRKRLQVALRQRANDEDLGLSVDFT